MAVQKRCRLQCLQHDFLFLAVPTQHIHPSRQVRQQKEKKHSEGQWAEPHNKVRSLPILD